LSPVILRIGENRFLAAKNSIERIPL